MQENKKSFRKIEIKTKKHKKIYQDFKTRKCHDIFYQATPLDMRWVMNSHGLWQAEDFVHAIVISER